jgi:hypothetical protein
MILSKNVEFLFECIKLYSFVSGHSQKFTVCISLFLLQSFHEIREIRVQGATKSWKFCFIFQAYNNLRPNFNNHIEQNLHILSYQYKVGNINIPLCLEVFEYILHYSNHSLNRSSIRLLSDAESTAEFVCDLNLDWAASLNNDSISPQSKIYHEQWGRGKDKLLFPASTEKKTLKIQAHHKFLIYKHIRLNLRHWKSSSCTIRP